MQSKNLVFLATRWIGAVLSMLLLLAACRGNPVGEPTATPTSQVDVPTATITPTVSNTATLPFSPTPANSDAIVESAVLPMPYIGQLPEGATARLGQGSVTYIKTSPNTLYLGVGTSTGVLVYDAATQQLLWTAPTPRNVSIVVWSPDSSKFAAGLYNGAIIAWDAPTGHELFESQAYGNNPVNLEWTLNGSYLVSSTRDGMAVVWDAANGRILHKLVYEDIPPDPDYTDITDMYAALSPDGRTYATIYDYGVEIPWPSSTIALWDVATGSLLRTLDASDYSVHSLAWSPDGTKLANGSDVAAYIGIWDTTTGENVEHLLAGTTRFDVYWSPDSRKIIAASPVYKSFTLIAPYPDEGPVVLDVASGEQLFDIPLDQDGTDYYNGSYLLNWSPDSAHVSVHNGRGKVTTYDTNTGEVLNQIENRMVSQASTPDQSGYYIVDYQGSSQLLKLWDVKSGAFTKTLLVESDFASSLSWSPDGQNLALGTGYYCASNQAMVWNVSTGKLTVVLDTVTSCPGVGVAWSPDGKTLAVGYDETVRLLDTIGWTEITRFATSDRSAFAWSPDSMRVAIGEDYVWDIAAHRALFPITGDSTNPVYSSDGKVLVTTSGTGGADEIIVWDGNTGERLHKLSNEAPYIDSIAISADGSLLGTVDDYYPQDTCGRVKIWNIKAAQVRNTISSSNLPGAGCPSSIALSPDGKFLAVAFTDTSSGIALLDTQTSKILRTLRGHAGYIYELAFSPDGKLLASASSDGTIILWNMSD